LNGIQWPEDRPTDGYTISESLESGQACFGKRDCLTTEVDVDREQGDFEQKITKEAKRKTLQNKVGPSGSLTDWCTSLTD
jgi:hypothetical protein